jgi:hypothetical protein
MHALIREASRALAANDADMLEHLALQALRETGIPQDDWPNVVRASAILSAQISAAAAHLAVRARVLAARDSYGAGAWGR